jgi:hypothetical protein
MYYRSGVKQSWRNPGKKRSVLIVFNSPQVW